jgi:DNA-binding transcriptional MerR regulator
MTAPGLRIGTVAARAGVKIDTIRYYERRGILPAASRKSSGYRSFAPNTVDRIVFVKELQALGFSLDEIVAILRLVDQGTANCGDARPLAEASLGRIDGKIRALTAVRSRLAAVLGGCDAGCCALVEAAAIAIRANGPRARA